MRKIMFVTNCMSSGGAERVVSVLSNTLCALKYEVAVFVYKTTEGEYSLSEGIHRVGFGKQPRRRLPTPILRRMQRVRILRKVITEENPDVVIPFLDAMVYETYLATLGTGIPVIATVRNKPADDNWLNRVQRDFVFPRCSAVFMQTEAQKQFFSKAIQDKTFVLSNPVDAQVLEVGKSSPYLAEKKVKKIITCGRLNSQKNHTLLIKAMKLVHEKHPDAELEIFGEGNAKAELESVIKELEAQEYVRLKGRTNQISEVLSAADVFVLSSDYEGMPNALMEAMAAGLPCISTDCPTGPKELLGNNERGILVPMGDARQMAQAINEMIERPDSAQEYAHKAHRFVADSYAPEIIANKLVKECEKV